MRSSTLPGSEAGRWAIALSASLVFGSYAQAQVSVLSISVTSCAGCSLRVDSVVTLGGREVEGEYFRWPVMRHNTVRLMNGRFVVAATAPVQVFAADGRSAGTIGRQGQGPGEFPSINPSIVRRGPQGALFFFPRAAQRVLHFDSSLRSVRTVTLRKPGTQHVVLTDGRYAALTTRRPGMQASDQITQPLFTVFDRTGDSAASGGTVVTIADQHIAPGVGGTIWTAKAAPYELKQWSANGELLRVIRRTTPFFDERPYDWPKQGEPARPVVATFRQDGAGRLWVAVMSGGPAGSTHTSTIVEVLDPSTGALIVSRRVPFLVADFLDDGYLTALSSSLSVQDATGAWVAPDPVVRIYRVVLEGPASVKP